MTDVDAMVDVVIPMSMFARTKRDDGTIVLVADRSDVDAYTGRRPDLLRFVVHGDAADVMFRLDRVDYADTNREDIAGWYFVPSDEVERRKLRRPCEILLVND